MISHDHKVIFVHIPRTGGHSISTCLGYTGKVPKVDKFPRHAHLNKYKLRFPKECKQYFKFIFVRNPFDRIVSAFFKSISYKDYDRAYLRTKIDNLLIPKFEKYILNNFKQHSAHYRDQHLWFQDENGNSIKNEYDFIGRFETLENDLKYVCRLLNIHRDIIPRISPSLRKKDYKLYYKNPEVRQKIKEEYKKDLDLLDYTFEGMK